MRYDKINTELFKYNRQRFIEKLPFESVAIFSSNENMPTNGDDTMGFVQNSNLFYLSGLDQENTLLIIRKYNKSKEAQTILFITENNDFNLLWAGKKLSKSESAEISGIKEIEYINSFWQKLEELIFPSTTIFYPSDSRLPDGFVSQEKQLTQKLFDRYPDHFFQKSEQILEELRPIKHKIEIDLIKKAIETTCKGMYRAAKSIQENKYEYEIEANISHEFLLNKSRFHAFQPIVAGGKNTCILHYIHNDQTLQEGELVLVDIGAEYANYFGDMTRTFPVSGKFSSRQKDVYNAVLNVFNFAKKHIIVRNTIAKLQVTCLKKMGEELIKLGLIENAEKAELIKKYFPHGISHFLGLNVHDVGAKNRIFEAGMLLTCEPGIYIAAENLGIRLENVILITEKGNIDLMKDFPIRVSEIEEMMK